MDLAPEVAAKILIYASLLLAIGANAAHWVFAPRVTSHPNNLAEEFDHRLASICTAAAVVMFTAQIVRVVAHTASAFGWSDAFTWSQLSVIALESRWGGSWRPQVAAAGLLLASVFVFRFHRRTGWMLTSAAVIGCAVSMPLLGHGASTRYGLVIHSAHILGAGLWLGTLACVLLVRRGGATDLLRHFAPFALTAAGVVVVAGAIAAIEYVGSLNNLWSTAYGRTLLVKLALFAGVVVCGYRNWRRWAAVPPGDMTDLRVETTESFLGLAIIIVTSVLTELAHP